MYVLTNEVTDLRSIIALRLLFLKGRFDASSKKLMCSFRWLILRLIRLVKPLAMASTARQCNSNFKRCLFDAEVLLIKLLMLVSCYCLRSDFSYISAKCFCCTAWLQMPCLSPIIFLTGRVGRNMKNRKFSFSFVAYGTMFAYYQIVYSIWTFSILKYWTQN